MPILEMNRLRTRYRNRNRHFFNSFMQTKKAKRLIYEVGEVISGGDLSTDSVLYITEGHCIRSLDDSQGNNQAILMASPDDIVGLSTRFNGLVIPGGAKVIERLIGIEIPNDELLNWSKHEPLLLYENMQNEIMMANSSIRMNGMLKIEKIYYILIELLRYNYIKNGDAFQFKSYISQAVIAEFSGVSESYVSRVLGELKAQEIFNPNSVELICEKVDMLIALSEPHKDFSLTEIFQME